jgi:diguanylate cyclase (GGDEF)-like protein/PAS domain S-box-containing protein
VKNEDKSKETLRSEVLELRRRITELENLVEQKNQMEAVLKVKEEKAHTILENIEDGYYEVDLAGNYLSCNKAYASIHGLTKEELIGRSYKKTEGQDSNETYEIFNSVYRTGIPVKSFKRIGFNKDGSQREWESSISLIKDKNGRPIGFRGITRDITEPNRMERELERTISLLEATIESTTDGILVVDQQGHIVRLNKKFVELWRIPDSILKAKEDSQALSFVLNQLVDPEEFFKKVTNLYAHPDDESFDTIEFKDGRIFERYSKPQQIDGESIGRVWSFRDITQRKRAEEALRTLSLKDDLTGLYNRRGFLNLAEQELKIANRLNRGMSLFFIDLDYLKEINDRYGHLEGDQALKAVAEVIKKTYRDSDILARIGGDEFVILAFEGASAFSPGNLRIRLTKNLQLYNSRQERPYILSISVGVVRYNPQRHGDIEELIAEADIKMYEEKTNKKYLLQN